MAVGALFEMSRKHNWARSHFTSSVNGDATRGWCKQPLLRRHCCDESKNAIVLRILRRKPSRTPPRLHALLALRQVQVRTRFCATFHHLLPAFAQASGRSAFQSYEAHRVRLRLVAKRDSHWAQRPKNLRGVRVPFVQICCSETERNDGRGCHNANDDSRRRRRHSGHHCPSRFSHATARPNRRDVGTDQ